MGDIGNLREIPMTRQLVCDWSTQIILSPDWFSSVQLSTKLVADLIALCNVDMFLSIQNVLQCHPTIFPPLTLESPLYEREYITMRYIKTLTSLSITVQKETYLHCFR